MPKPRETRSKSSEKELRKAEEEGEKERRNGGERERREILLRWRKRRKNRNPLVISCNVASTIVFKKFSLLAKFFLSSPVYGSWKSLSFSTEFFPKRTLLLTLVRPIAESPFVRSIPFLIIRREIHEIFTRPLIVPLAVNGRFCKRVLKNRGGGLLSKVKRGWRVVKGEKRRRRRKREREKERKWRKRKGSAWKWD